MATYDNQSDIKRKIEVNEKIKPPKLYKVIYLNDNVTTIEFVVNSLVEIFSYTPEAADKMAIKIHTDGSACVVVLPYEIAEQKGVEVTILARNAGFPLQVRLEIDNQ